MSVISEQVPNHVTDAAARQFLSTVLPSASDLRAQVRAVGPARESDVRTEIDRILSQVSSSRGTVREQVEVFLEAAWGAWFRFHDQSYALDLAASAVKFAEQRQDRFAARRANTVRGILLSTTGNPSGAVDCFVTALEMATALEEGPGAICGLWNNLGAALMESGLYADALRCFDRCLQVGGSSAETRAWRAKAFINKAYCYLHLCDYAPGLDAARNAIVLIGNGATPEDLHDRIVVECTFTRLLLRTNNVGEAAVHAKMARAFADRATSPQSKVPALIAEGLVEVDSRQFDIGLSRLNQALEMARQQVPLMLRDALASLVEACRVTSDFDRAIKYQRELDLHISRTNRDAALRHHNDHIRRLGIEESIAAKAAVEELDLLDERALKKLAARPEVFAERIELLERMAAFAELRDDSTGNHSYRVGRLASLLGNAYGLDSVTCKMLDLAARLHDIGKIGIPDAILLKPGKLSESEMEKMRLHTTEGADLLARSSVPDVRMAEDIARFHHEWWSGDGYPHGIAENAIPLAARITALADVFDALTHERPYKRAWPIDEALQEIVSLAGRQFEPYLVTLFIDLIRSLQRSYPDLDEYLARDAEKAFVPRTQKRIHDIITRPQGPTQTQLSLI